MIKHRIIFFVAAATFLVFTIDGQTRPKTGAQVNKTSEGVTCETIIDAIDRSLTEATDKGTKVIVIVKSGRNASHSLNVGRAKGLRNYFVYRGFTDFEVGVDVLRSDSARVDIYVAGGKLFSLPIGSRDDLDLSPCALGVEK
jgi:hypothetical protein